METMTVRDAARELGVHENTIRNWMESGFLGYEAKPSGFRRPTVESVKAAIEHVRPHTRAGVLVVPVKQIYDVLPRECWVTRSTEVFCTEFVGGTFPAGGVWTEAMCCLPCRIRSVCKVYGGDE
jgi:hypothetical protein